MLYFTIFFFQQYNVHMKLGTFPIAYLQVLKFIHQLHLWSVWCEEPLRCRSDNQSIQKPEHTGYSIRKTMLPKIITHNSRLVLIRANNEDYWRHKTEQGRDSGGVKARSVLYNIGYNDICLSTLLQPDCLQDFFEGDILKKMCDVLRTMKTDKIHTLPKINEMI